MQMFYRPGAAVHVIIPANDLMNYQALLLHKYKHQQGNGVKTQRFQDGYVLTSTTKTENHKFSWWHSEEKKNKGLHVGSGWR